MMRVDLEALAGSAVRVSQQGDELAAAHLASDNRIAAAQSGWVGASAAALDARTATWLDISRSLLTRVGEHAMELTNDGITLAALERENTAKMRAASGGIL
jgi:uncharacterized protein YukE